MSRIIAHIDLDAFFASVEERDNPRFRGQPIVIGADPQEGRGRGVVSTANYPAREYGIGSAMPISRAWKLSQKAKAEGKPEAIFLPVDMKKYALVSRRVMELIQKASPTVEQASVDEAYLDLSHLKTFKAAQAACVKLKKAIKKDQKITASIGLGPNKLIAKIASGYQKPDGLTVITKDQAEDFLEPMSVRAIPGIGPKTEKVLAAEGIMLVRDLKKYSKEKLQEIIGNWGIELYEKIRGRDESSLVTYWEPKSIGEQETFEQDTLKTELLFDRLKAMSESVGQSLIKEGFKTYRTIVLTVRFADFQTLTKSHTLPEPRQPDKTLYMEVLKIFMPYLDKRGNPNKKLIRLLGVRLEKLN